MYCGHPSLVDDHLGIKVQISTKYLRLFEILDEIIESERKCLVFASFTRMVDLICDHAAARYGGFVDFIDGRVDNRARHHVLDEFQQHEGSAVLVLNPAAAGTGLNIAAATNVIHYNLEWNPAVIDQATSRAYRIGQSKPVTVHQLYYLDTIEEVIYRRLEKKRALADEAVEGVIGEEDDLMDLAEALSLTPWNPT